MSEIEPLYQSLFAAKKLLFDMATLAPVTKISKKDNIVLDWVSYIHHVI